MTRMSVDEFKKIQGKQAQPKEKESVIQFHIKRFLQYKGWFVFKNHQSLGSHRGVADLYAIKNGISLWIEVKTATGKLSEDQKKFRDDIIHAGGNYFVARSIDDVIEVLKLF